MGRGLQRRYSRKKTKCRKLPRCPCSDNQKEVVQKMVWVREEEVMRSICRLLPYRKAAMASKQKPPNASDGSEWPKDKVIVIDESEDEEEMVNKQQMMIMAIPEKSHEKRERSSGERERG
ncbi:hypothetical protein AMTRI_Chr12g233630 [Amborella trichopoda]